MATKKRRPIDALARVQRLEREHEDQPYEFEPTEQPPPEVQKHHFVVNGSFREEPLEELSDDVLAVTNEPAENLDLVPFVRQQIGLRLMNWHASQDDSIYAVGSTYFDEHGAGRIYPQVAVLQRAHSELETLARKERGREAKRELAVILEWLGWELVQAKMVNNPEGNHGQVSVVTVRFGDGSEHEVEDAVELEELTHEHGRFMGATLRRGRSAQKAFWGEWSRKRWPRSMEDLAAWFDLIEHFNDDQLRALSRIGVPATPGRRRSTASA
jgi:hypothetical protein